MKPVYPALFSRDELATIAEYLTIVQQDLLQLARSLQLASSLHVLITEQASLAADYRERIRKELSK